MRSAPWRPIPLIERNQQTRRSRGPFRLLRNAGFRPKVFAIYSTGVVKVLCLGDAAIAKSLGLKITASVAVVSAIRRIGIVARLFLATTLTRVGNVVPIAYANDASLELTR